MAQFLVMYNTQGEAVVEAADEATAEAAVRAALLAKTVDPQFVNVNVRAVPPVTTF